jgi:hypothetical protein
VHITLYSTPLRWSVKVIFNQHLSCKCPKHLSLYSMENAEIIIIMLAYKWLSKKNILLRQDSKDVYMSLYHTYSTKNSQQSILDSVDGFRKLTDFVVSKQSLIQYQYLTSVNMYLIILIIPINTIACAWSYILTIPTNTLQFTSRVLSQVSHGCRCSVVSCVPQMTVHSARHVGRRPVLTHYFWQILSSFWYLSRRGLR